MAIPTLTPEQVATWSREEKDRWWLANVFRGDMAQLTIRSAVTGFLLGGLLSATNLYIGAKTGWSLGVGLTSVILAFAMFKVLSSIGLAKDFTILENNAMQSTATAAGYMTGPLISGIAAYMMVSNVVMPWWQMLSLNVVLAILGVFVAFPMKRRFINDEQAPFPEGAACGVVLDTLYTSDARVGLFKAKALAIAALVAGALKFCMGEGYQKLLQGKILGQKVAWHLAEHLDYLYYKLNGPVIRIFGGDIRNFGLSPTLDLAMFGAGGLMNVRYATNMVVGMAIMWGFLAPMAVSWGDVMGPNGDILTPAMSFKYRDVLVSWALWSGVAMLVMASMASLFAKPQVFVAAFATLFGKHKSAGSDPLRNIEVPLWISFVGVPVVGAIGVWMLHDWFGVKWQWGALAVPLIIALTLVAAQATSMTSITPTGSLSKITQFTFGALDRQVPATNLMTALMTTEVASNASNLLMDIKPGYMLGAKPRQQAIGHVIGIIAGACASTPLFYVLFLSGRKEGASILETMTDKFPFPGALQWKGVSDLVSKGIGGMPNSALVAMIVAAAIGLIFEIVRVVTKGKSPVSPLAIGLGIVLPPDSTMAMFAGALFFTLMSKRYKAREGSFGKRLWVDTHEPICAGIIAGAALIGIGDILVQVFALK